MRVLLLFSLSPKKAQEERGREVNFSPSLQSVRELWWLLLRYEHSQKGPQNAKRRGTIKWPFLGLPTFEIPFEGFFLIFQDSISVGLVDKALGKRVSSGCLTQVLDSRSGTFETKSFSFLPGQMNLWTVSLYKCRIGEFTNLPVLRLTCQTREGLGENQPIGWPMYPERASKIYKRYIFFIKISLLMPSKNRKKISTKNLDRHLRNPEKFPLFCLKVEIFLFDISWAFFPEIFSDFSQKNISPVGVNFGVFFEAWFWPQYATENFQKFRLCWEVSLALWCLKTWGVINQLWWKKMQ